MAAAWHLIILPEKGGSALLFLYFFRKHFAGQRFKRLQPVKRREVLGCGASLREKSGDGRGELWLNGY